MPPPLSHHRVAVIRGLLSQGLPQDKIKKILHCGGSVVSKIARGIYVEKDTEVEAVAKPSGPYVRCKCGHKTQQPCVVCRVRELQSRQKVA